MSVMTGLNHAMTGIAIAVTVKNPVLAPVVALVSHFVLDALPHFGHPKLEPGRKAFDYYLMLEAVFMTAVTVAAMFLFSEQWFLVGLCAFLAFSPDILWYFKSFRPHPAIAKKLAKYFAFTSVIQWYERPPGAIVEIVYLLSLIGLINSIYLA